MTPLAQRTAQQVAQPGAVPAARDRIRLLQFATVFGLGGTERHLVNLSRRLDRGSFDLELACMNRWGHFLKDFDEQNIHISEYPVRNLYGPGAFLQRLRFARSLIERKISIVHSYNFHANVFAVPAARLARVPIVIASIRDNGTHLSPAKRQTHRYVCRLADHVLVNADAIRSRMMKAGIPESRISVIHNGVDLDRFDLVDRTGPALRHELGLPPQTPIVALLARLDPVKRVEDFLEAAALVAARIDRARFLVVGDEVVPENRGEPKPSSYRSELEAQVERLGLGSRVIFTGLRLDVSRVLIDVAVSVLPSSSEGLSNTILESMAARVPVVATAVGGTPEVVDDGRTGLLVPPQDPGALAGAIVRLLEDQELARRFGFAGREKVERCFSLGKMVADTERLYERLLEETRRRS
jgi:glycosyltransferase involved in cell wall biosynthesis